MSAVIGMANIGKGSVSVLTDSSCLDPHLKGQDCLWVVSDFLSFAINKTELPEIFKLPYDYDVHVAYESESSNVTKHDLPTNRRDTLKCNSTESPDIADYISYRHILTNIKIREWRPNSMVYEDIDLVLVAEILVCAFVFILVGYLLCSKRNSQ